MKVAGTKPSDLVAVFGVGGLGHLAIQCRPLRAAAPSPSTSSDEKPSWRELGATHTVNAVGELVEDPEASAAPTRRSHFAVSPASFEQAYRSLRRGGTLLRALPKENHIELPIFETVLNGVTVVGSIVGTRNDLREVFELHAQGRTRVIRETRPLAEVNEAIAEVEAGRVAARIVFTP